MMQRGPLKRAKARFAENPGSVRNATVLMIVITAVIAVAAALFIRVFDAQDFPDLGGALWFTLQTVTTVGYGDMVPTTGVGRAAGAVVMMVAIALVAILTASITSTFVEAAQRRTRATDQAQGRDPIEVLGKQLDEVLTRLTAIEARLDADDADRAVEHLASQDPEVRRPA